MQNKYFGDKHDFYKYLLLKYISEYYSLGIHWCLVPDEPQKNDGKKTLSNLEMDKESTLFNILKNSKKNITSIENYFKKNVKYFIEKHEHFYMDHFYQKNSIEKLKNQEIIFFDPDNGIEVLSTNNKNKFKYVSYSLLANYWKMGKTLIIYQHKDRNKESTNEKINYLCETLKCNKFLNIEIVRKGNVKYIFIINKKHFKLKKIIADFINDNNEYKKDI